MRTIIYVSPHIGKDGAEKSLVSLMHFVSTKGIKPIVIIPKAGPIVELLDEKKITYFIEPFYNWVNCGQGKRLVKGIAKYLKNIIAANVIKKRLRREDYDIIGVHSNVITSDFGYHLSNVLNVPHIWHIREFGKLDFNFDFDLGETFVAKRFKKAKCMIANSEAVKEYYKSFNPDAHIVRVYNGIKFDSKSDIKHERIGVFRMILIGRLSEEKGQMDALQMCSKLKEEGIIDFKLDLYGDGVDKEKLIHAIQDLNIAGNVELKGYCSSIPINLYDVGLMCSKNEAFGRVTVEYMANAIPVIGTKSGGTAELIKDNINGFLYNVGDLDAFVEKIKALYMDEALCVRLGQAGKKFVKNHFTEKIYWNNVYAYYKKYFQIG